MGIGPAPSPVDGRAARHLPVRAETYRKPRTPSQVRRSSPQDASLRRLIWKVRAEPHGQFPDMVTRSMNRSARIAQTRKGASLDAQTINTPFLGSSHCGRCFSHDIADRSSSIEAKRRRRPRSPDRPGCRLARPVHGKPRPICGRTARSGSDPSGAANATAGACCSVARAARVRDVRANALLTGSPGSSTTAGTTLSVWPRCLKGVGRGVWQGTGREATADGAGTAGGAWAPRLRCVELGMSEAAGRARSALGAGHETGGRSGVQGRDPRFKKQKHVSISTDVRPAHRKSRSMSRSESLAVAPPISL
jgi:hypothetical protein